MLSNNSVVNCYYNSVINSGIQELTSAAHNYAPPNAVTGATDYTLNALMPTLYDYPSGLTSNNQNSTIGATKEQIFLQVGINSDSSSSISLDVNFSIKNIDDLRMIGLDLTTDYLSKVDDMLRLVSEKQAHFGAVVNRLESVIEEITIQRESLITSRSTLI